MSNISTAALVEQILTPGLSFKAFSECGARTARHYAQKIIMMRRDENRCTSGYSLFTKEIDPAGITFRRSGHYSMRHISSKTDLNASPREKMAI